MCVDNSNDESNFPHKRLLTNTQVSRLWKAFANASSANINFPKTQKWCSQEDFFLIS